MPVFPALTTGAVTQFPFVAQSTFLTAKVEHEPGQQYAYAHVAAALKSWELTYSMITNAEAETLRAFFAARKGKLETFDFTDPDTATLHTVRFDQDSISITNDGIDQNAVTVKLQKVAA